MASIRAAGMVKLGGAMSLSVGGAETNVAIGLARLGHHVRWAGRVGSDEFGSLVLRTLRAEGVGIEAATVDDVRATGLMIVEKRLADTARVAYYREGSAGSAIAVDNLRGLFDGSPRVLHLTGITPALSRPAADAVAWAARTARERGILVSFDVNYRSALWSRSVAARAIAPIAALANVVFASDGELGLVATGDSEEDMVDELRAAGVDEVIVKRGADGAAAWSAAGHVAVAARKVPVVDTIGAGDAFTAGYLSALLDDQPLATRLDRGAVLGAFAVTVASDWEALPTRHELELLDREAGETIR